MNYNKTYFAVLRFQEVEVVKKFSVIKERR